MAVSPIEAIVYMEIGCCLRRSHLLTVEHQLGELNADLGVVDGRGY